MSRPAISGSGLAEENEEKPFKWVDASGVVGDGVDEESDEGGVSYR